MKVFSASATIDASPDKIWALITDAPTIPSWDPGLIRIDGRIAPGEKITVYSKVSPNRAFPVKVSEFVPGKKMTWVGGMPLGLFTGTRTFTLTPRGGRVDFELKEVYTGAMLGMMSRSLPDLTPVFEAYVAGLKARAERAA
ncbi:MAG: SRPBCC domain-containing protein [Anaerolinea sp.]|nr:SRPBCC domain-containing protein [Anaerolinea sp.]